jgi:hypothetical protein
MRVFTVYNRSVINIKTAQGVSFYLSEPELEIHRSMFSISNLLRI